MVGKNIYFNEAVLGMAEIFVILVTIFLTFILYLFFALTKLGISMVAASQNQLAAFYVGIPVNNLQSLTWVIAGILAGIRLAPRSYRTIASPSNHSNTCQTTAGIWAGIRLPPPNGERKTASTR